MHDSAHGKVFKAQRPSHNQLAHLCGNRGRHDTVASFAVNQAKADEMLLTADFFANKTVGMSLDPLQAMDNYGMRDEHAKCIALQKDQLGHNRLRAWPESGRHGRMLICFVGLILASYVRSVWEGDELLRKCFDSTEIVLTEMRAVRCIEQISSTYPRRSSNAWAGPGRDTRR